MDSRYPFAYFGPSVEKEKDVAFAATSSLPSSSTRTRPHDLADSTFGSSFAGRLSFAESNSQPIAIGMKNTRDLQVLLSDHTALEQRCQRLEMELREMRTHLDIKLDVHETPSSISESAAAQRGLSCTCGFKEAERHAQLPDHHEEHDLRSIPPTTTSGGNTSSFLEVRSVIHSMPLQARPAPAIGYGPSKTLPPPRNPVLVKSAQTQTGGVHEQLIEEDNIAQSYSRYPTPSQSMPETSTGSNVLLVQQQALSALEVICQMSSPPVVSESLYGTTGLPSVVDGDRAGSGTRVSADGGVDPFSVQDSASSFVASEGEGVGSEDISGATTAKDVNSSSPSRSRESKSRQPAAGKKAEESGVSESRRIEKKSRSSSSKRHHTGRKGREEKSKGSGAEKSKKTLTPSESIEVRRDHLRKSGNLESLAVMWAREEAGQKLRQQRPVGVGPLGSMTKFLPQSGSKEPSDGASRLRHLSRSHTARGYFTGGMGEGLLSSSDLLTPQKDAGARGPQSHSLPRDHQRPARKSVPAMASKDPA